MIERTPLRRAATDPLDVPREEKQRRAAVVSAMLHSWLEDESGYDESVLPQLEKALDVNREQAGDYRKLFP